jgi:sugar-specific transcriptional regulator TrmB
MATHQQPETDGKARPLEILGISEAEEQTYRWLLAHPGATAVEMARAQSRTPARIQRVVDRIESKGLVTHSLEQPRHYIPSSPDVAIEALALEHHQAVQRAQAVIPELQEQITTRQHDEQKRKVELVTSASAKRQIFEQMQRGAQREMVTLTRPPVLISRLDVPYEQDQYRQREAQARGVRYRSIVDSDFLALPGAVARVQADMQMGETIRVYPHLPIKLVISDKRLALVLLDVRQANGSFLLIRSSALLNALYALFETLWAQAVPISFSQAGALDRGNQARRLPEEIEEMMPLLTAGLNDKSIACELDISTRTLERRVACLMRELGTRTRFQTGWQAALRWSCETFSHEKDSSRI